MTKKILLALLLGFITGLILHFMNLSAFSDYIKPIGEVFIKLLKMMIVPLVMSSVFMAIVNLGNPKDLGSIGLKTLIYYFITTAIAAAIGLIIVNIINPGLGLDLQNLQSETLTESLALKLNESANNGLFKTILNVFMDAIPTNPFSAMANATILQVIFFSIFFGIGALFYKQESTGVINFMQSLESLCMRLTHGLMTLAPIGIFALVTNVFATSGLSILGGLLKYVLTVLIGLTIHFGVLLFIGSIKSQKSPIEILRALAQTLLTAFSTSSSAATLPITMANVEDNLGVDKKTAQFVLPLGATINMDGTALYESVSVIFIGQAFGLDITIAQQLIIFFTASLAAIGAAAIPGAGLVTMSIVLTAVGFPMEGIGLVLTVERILDMFRTTVNVFGDCIGTVVVDSYLKKSPIND